MRDKIMARFILAGAALSGIDIPTGKRFVFAENEDIKNSLSVCDGENIIGYVTGSEAALIKAFLARGMNMYCEYVGRAENEESVRYIIQVYYIPERI